MSDLARDRNLVRHTGADSKLKIQLGDGDYEEIPITNVDWDRDYDTESIQHNGSISPTLATTSVSYSGSFEYEGQNPDVQNLLVAGDEDQLETHRPQRHTMTIKEYSHEDGDEVEIATITFKRVIITDTSRDVPADDVSNTSYSWEAEDMSYIDER